MMTAFYMFRLMGMTFWGPSHVDPEIEPKIHESPPSMTGPLILLAIPSVLIGLVLGLPFGASRIQEWLEPVFARSDRDHGPDRDAGRAVRHRRRAHPAQRRASRPLGMILAWRYFGVDIGILRRDPRPDEVHAIATATSATRFLYRASLNKWWFDELNDLLFMRIGGRVADAAWWFDRTIIDGAVNEIGAIFIGFGGGLRRVQTGRVQNYALGIAIGLIVMAGSYLVIVSR